MLTQQLPDGQTMQQFLQQPEQMAAINDYSAKIANDRSELDDARRKGQYIKTASVIAFPLLVSGAAGAGGATGLKAALQATSAAMGASSVGIGVDDPEFAKKLRLAAAAAGIGSKLAPNAKPAQWVDPLKQDIPELPPEFSQEAPGGPGFTSLPDQREIGYEPFSTQQSVEDLLSSGYGGDDYKQFIPSLDVNYPDMFQGLTQQEVLQKAGLNVPDSVKNAIKTAGGAAGAAGTGGDFWDDLLKGLTTAGISLGAEQLGTKAQDREIKDLFENYQRALEAEGISEVRAAEIAKTRVAEDLGITQEELNRQMGYATEDIERTRGEADVATTREQEDFAAAQESLNRSQNMQDLLLTERLMERGITPSSGSSIGQSETARLAAQKAAERKAMETSSSRRLEDITHGLGGAETSYGRYGEDIASRLKSAGLASTRAGEDISTKLASGVAGRETELAGARAKYERLTPSYNELISQRLANPSTAYGTASSALKTVFPDIAKYIT